MEILRWALKLSNDLLNFAGSVPASRGDSKSRALPQPLTSVGGHGAGTWQWQLCLGT